MDLMVLPAVTLSIATLTEGGTSLIVTTVSFFPNSAQLVTSNEQSSKTTNISAKASLLIIYLLRSSLIYIPLQSISVRFTLAQKSTIRVYLRSASPKAIHD